jgi:chemotaxis protein histidine kinase CheA
MGEPSLDLSEIIDLYKEDARLMIEKMRSAVASWKDIQNGGPARTDLRRLSHQLRGSGRTYGFRSATRICKAIENITLKMDKNSIPVDERVRESIQKKLECLAAVFGAP